MSQVKQIDSGAWGDRLRALRNLPPLLRILWDSGPSVVTWGIVLRLVVAALPLGIASVAAWIINGIQGHMLGQPLRPNFWWMVALELALAVTMAAILRIIDYLDSLLSDRYTHYVSIRVMDQASKLDLTTYEDPIFYDRLERARVQATDRLAMIQQIGRLLQQSVTTLVITVLLLRFSPWLLLFMAAGVLPSFFGETHYAFLGYAKNFRQTPAKRQMDYLRQVAGSREGAKELKVFGLSGFLTNRFRAISQRIFEENVALSRRKLFWGGGLTLLGTFGYYSSYAFVIWQALHGAYNIGIFALLTTAIQQASSNLQQAFSTGSGIADQALFLTDLIAFFEMKPKLRSKPDAIPAPRPIRQGFEFRNVSFIYPGTERYVLRNFNFVLEPGERIALIGENGQGKTTVVKLITRLYDPTEGQILLDGVDLREYSLEDLHREVGVIFQDFMRYDMTAQENIGMGRVEVANNVFQIRAAAMKSYAENLIKKLPRGYDQLLGCRFEGGIELSGGEWQKIALARAHLRDAQLLILD